MGRDVLTLIRLDRRSNLPLSEQLQKNLESLILGEVLAFKETIPAAQTIADTLRMSLVDVQIALKHLQERRFLKTSADGSTYVSYYPLASEFSNKLYTVWQALTDLGLKPVMTKSSQTVQTVDAATAKRMGFEHERTFLRVQRLVVADGIPYALLVQFFPQSMIKPLEDRIQGDVPIWPILREHGFVLSYAKRTVRAIRLKGEFAKTFGEAPNTACLQVESRLYDASDTLLEYNETILASRYFFRVETTDPLLHQKRFLSN